MLTTNVRVFYRGPILATVILAFLFSFLLRPVSQEWRRLTDDPTYNVATSFLGFPVAHQAAPSSDAVYRYESTVHCTGDDFRENDAWMFRSCQFWNLCWDISTKTFLYFASVEELELQELLSTLQPGNLVAVSSMTWSNHRTQPEKQTVKSVSLGTVRSSESSLKRWFPEVIADPKQQQAILARGYYQLADDVTFVPFQLTSPLRFDVWSDFFALHTVLAMFGLEHKRPALLQYSDGAAGSSAKQPDDTWFPVDWLAAFVSPTTQVGTLDTAILRKSDGAPDEGARSDLVCAKTSVAGLGMIGATHRMDAAFDVYEAPILTHTIGRGVALYAFRQYVLNNLRIQDKDATVGDARTTSSQTAWSITIAFESPVERKGWPEQIHTYLSGALPEHEDAKKNSMSIELLDLQDIDIRALAQRAIRSNVYIAQSGLAHTLVAATCLCRGSTLIVLDDENTNPSATSDQVFRSSQRSEQHVLESAGYFRVHWVTFQQQKQLDQATLTKLVKSVLAGIDEPLTGK